MCRLGKGGTISFPSNALKNEIFTNGDRKSSDRYQSSKSRPAICANRWLAYPLRLEEGAAGVELRHRDMVLRVDPGSSPRRRREVIDEWYRRDLRIAAVPLVHKWEVALELQLSRFFVQRMKTKWGSSNPTLRTIRLNLELAKKSPECLDYVVLHEMLHFLVPDHSARFQVLLDEEMPWWRHVRRSLNEAPLFYGDSTA